VVGYRQTYKVSLGAQSTGCTHKIFCTWFLPHCYGRPWNRRSESRKKRSVANSWLRHCYKISSLIIFRVSCTGNRHPIPGDRAPAVSYQ